MNASPAVWGLFIMVEQQLLRGVLTQGGIRPPKLWAD
jgi:hypothetical protein